MCFNCNHETKHLNVVLRKFNSCMSNGHTWLALTIARDLSQLAYTEELMIRNGNVLNIKENKRIMWKNLSIIVKMNLVIYIMFDKLCQNGNYELCTNLMLY